MEDNEIIQTGHILDNELKRQQLIFERVRLILQIVTTVAAIIGAYIAIVKVLA